MAIKIKKKLANFYLYLYCKKLCLNDVLYSL